MKRLFSFMLVLVMSLTLIACGKSPSAAASLDVADKSTQAATSVVQVDPETVSTASEVPEAEQGPDWSKINPLTGEAVEQDISKNRPIAVMLNNIRQSLPQSGNSQADVLYEVPEEGGITRIMALYQDITDVGYLGSIRSTRPYYVQLAVAADSILVHAGGSGKAYKTIQKYMKKSDFTDLDFLSKDTRTAETIFWREQSRFDAGYASEHTLFTSSDKIQEYLEEHQEEIRLDHKDNYQFVHTFSQDATPTDGLDGKELNVNFSGYKSTSFTYSEESEKYLVSQFDSAYMDEAAGQQVAVTNVIVILTDITETGNAKNHVDIDIVGRGNGYYFNGGKYEPIIWSKVDVRDTYKFYKADGKTLFDLGVGKTFVCIVDKSRDITVDGTVLEKPTDATIRPDLAESAPISEEEEELY